MCCGNKRSTQVFFPRDQRLVSYITVEINLLKGEWIELKMETLDTAIGTNLSYEQEKRDMKEAKDPLFRPSILSYRAFLSQSFP